MQNRFKVGDIITRTRGGSYKESGMFLGNTYQVSSVEGYSPEGQIIQVVGVAYNWLSEYFTYVDDFEGNI